MKTAAAIFFLLILAFNTVGYRILFNYLEQRATARIEKKVDAGHYDERELVEVKIPLQAPYYSSWSDYEAHYGETEFDGKHYRYVKRKIVDNILYLLCIPDFEKSAIQNAGTEYFVINNTSQDQSGSDHLPVSMKLLMSEYIAQHSAILSAPELLVNTIRTALNSFMHSQTKPSLPGQPPEAIA